MGFFTPQRRDIITFHTTYFLPLPQDISEPERLKAAVRAALNLTDSSQIADAYLESDTIHAHPIGKIRLLTTKISRPWRKGFKKVLQVECDIEPRTPVATQSWGNNQELIQLLDKPAVSIFNYFGFEKQPFSYRYRAILGVLSPNQYEQACMYIDKATGRIIPSAKISSDTLDRF